jgi:hypothetical protein
VGCCPAGPRRRPCRRNNLRAVHATEGWGWAKTARRRLAEAARPAEGPFEVTDRTFDLAQGVEGPRSRGQVSEAGPRRDKGTELPPGIGWKAVRSFVRRSRDALAHGDERIASPGFDTCSGGRATTWSSTARREARGLAGAIRSR